MPRSHVYAMEYWPSHSQLCPARSHFYTMEYWLSHSELCLSEAMHVYMGENSFFLWSYHIGGAFKSTQLLFDNYRFFNHHLIHDIQQIMGGLYNLHKFQWAITSCFFYVEYWPENIKPCLPPCGGLCDIQISHTQQLPSESCSSPPYVKMTSHCSDRGFGMMYSASCSPYIIGLWAWQVLSGCMFTGSDQSCVFIHVLLK